MIKRVPVAHRQLNAEEREALLQGLALAANMAGASLPLTMDQVQTLYDAAIKVRLQDDEKLTAIGLAFGQQIVERTGFDWVCVSSEWGEEIVIAPHGKSVTLPPISMIKVKIANRESADLDSVANAVAETIESLLDDGQIRNWKPL